MILIYPSGVFDVSNALLSQKCEAYCISKRGFGVDPVTLKRVKALVEDFTDVSCGRLKSNGDSSRELSYKVAEIFLES